MYARHHQHAAGRQHADRIVQQGRGDRRDLQRMAQQHQIECIIDKGQRFVRCRLQIAPITVVAQMQAGPATDQWERRRAVIGRRAKQQGMRAETALQIRHQYAQLLLQQPVHWRAGVDVLIALAHAAGPVPIGIQSVTAGSSWQITADGECA